MNHQRAARSYFVDYVAGDLEHQQEVRVEGAAGLLEVHVDKASVMRLASCHHHVVDRGRQVTEESPQPLVRWSTHRKMSSTGLVRDFRYHYA
jgi:hypothetical protein